MSFDPEEVRAWSWWDSPQWTAYTNAYGSPAGRPVHGPSYVVDLTKDPSLSKGHKSAVKTQMKRQHIRRTVDVEPFHRAHDSEAGGETRSQETWEMFQQWLDEDHAVCVTNAEGGWAYFICDPPGAYYASAAGRDCHWLLFSVIEGLKEAGFEWLELGEGHTPGIDTYKRGFSSCVVEP